MKCKCGGDTKTSRVNITLRGKKYKPVSYKCKDCEREFEIVRIHIPIRKNND